MSVSYTDQREPSATSRSTPSIDGNGPAATGESISSQMKWSARSNPAARSGAAINPLDELASW